MRQLSITHSIGLSLPLAIRDILLVENLGNTPAMCLRSTRTMFVTSEFLQLPKDYQAFIIGHEAGHIALNTHNEYKADDYAVDWCMSQNIGLTNILFSMTKVLTFPEARPQQRAEQLARCDRQAQRIFEYDYKINHNPKANIMNQFHDTDSFLGFGKIAKGVGKAVTSQMEARNEIKKIKATSKAEARVTKAQTAANDKAAATTTAAAPTPPDEGAKIMGMPKQTFIMVAVGLVVLIGVAVWYLKFKK